MIKQTIFVSALFLGTSAYAQDTTTTATEQAQPAGPAQPSTTNQPSDPITTTTQSTPTDQTMTAPSGTQPAMPADPSTSTPATPAVPGSDAAGATSAEQAGGDAVATTVEADWAKYDANNGGTLSRTEFNKWVTDLQTAANNKAPTRGYLTSAFRKADADKNGSVSKEELQTFLRG